MALPFAVTHVVISRPPQKSIQNKTTLLIGTHLQFCIPVVENSLGRDGEMINIVADATLAAKAKGIRVQCHAPLARDRCRNLASDWDGQ